MITVNSLRNKLARYPKNARIEVNIFNPDTGQHIAWGLINGVTTCDTCKSPQMHIVFDLKTSAPEKSDSCSSR